MVGGGRFFGEHVSADRRLLLVQRLQRLNPIGQLKPQVNCQLEPNRITVNSSRIGQLSI